MAFVWTTERKERLIELVELYRDPNPNECPTALPEQNWKLIADTMNCPVSSAKWQLDVLRRAYFTQKIAEYKANVLGVPLVIEDGSLTSKIDCLFASTYSKSTEIPAVQDASMFAEDDDDDEFLRQLKEDEEEYEEEDEEVPETKLRDLNIHNPDAGTT